MKNLLLILALFSFSTLQALNKKLLEKTQVYPDINPIEINEIRNLEIGESIFNPMAVDEGYFLRLVSDSEVTLKTIRETPLMSFDEGKLVITSFNQAFTKQFLGNCITTWHGALCIRKSDLKKTPEKILELNSRHCWDDYGVNNDFLARCKSKKIKIQDLGLNFSLENRKGGYEFILDRKDSESIEVTRRFLPDWGMPEKLRERIGDMSNSLEAGTHQKIYIPLIENEPQYFFHFNVLDEIYMFEYLGNDKYSIKELKKADVDLFNIDKKFTKTQETLAFKWNRRDYLFELIDRCTNNFGFKEESEISSCVQKETFNDKQIAVLEEQNNILSQQSVNQSNNRGTEFLNAFIGGLTSGLISNAIQNRNTQPTIIYRNNPPPRFYTD